MNKLAAWIVVFFVLMALSAVSVSAAAPSVSNIWILSTDPLNRTIADLTCLWDYSDPELDADQSSMKWFVNSTVREIGGPVIRIGGFENGEGWYRGRDFKNRTLDTFVKTEGNSSIQFIFNNSFDTSLHAEHGITTSVFLVPTNISDEAVYSVDFYVEDPSVITGIQIRFGNDSLFIWDIWYEGLPLQPGWNRLYFFGRDRFPEGPEIGLTETNLDRYSFLVDNDDSDFQQVVRFDNLLQYVDPMLSSSQTTTGDEILCEVTPFDGTDTGTAINSSVFTVLPTPPCSELTDGQVLTESLILPGGCVYSLPNGISIQADDVTLDCNGAVINGSNLYDTTGITAQGKGNVTVQGCTIQNFWYPGWETWYGGTGISFEAMTNSRIFNNTILRARHGIKINGSTGGRNLIIELNRVENPTFEEDGAYGIRMHANDSRLLNNTVLFSVPGYLISVGGSNNLIAGNLVARPQPSDDWRFQRGLFVGGLARPSVNNTVIGNEVRNAEVSLELQFPEYTLNRAYDTLIVDNLLDNASIRNDGFNTTLCSNGRFNRLVGRSGIITTTGIDLDKSCAWNVPAGIEIAADHFDFDCNGVLINGSRQQHSSGVSGRDVRNITIRNCRIENYFFEPGDSVEAAISLGYVEDVIIINNTIVNVSDGILLNGSFQSVPNRNVLIAFNNIDGVGGIHLLANDSAILNNTIIGKGEGWNIGLMGHRNRIAGNYLFARFQFDPFVFRGQILIGRESLATDTLVEENIFDGTATSVYETFAPPEGGALNTTFRNNLFNNSYIDNVGENTTFCKAGVFNRFIGWSGIGTRTWFDIDPSCVWNVPGGIAMWETSDLDFDCHGALINGSNLEWGGGFQVQWSRNITIENCRIRNYGAPPDTCCSFGAAVFDSENITFRNLDIADSQFGFFGGSNRRLVEEDSTISGVDVGIGHWESEETNISRNIVTRAATGMSLGGNGYRIGENVVDANGTDVWVTNSSIAANVFTGPGSTISLSGENSLYMGNDFNDSVVMQDAFNNTFTNNTYANASFVLDNTTAENLLYENTFSGTQIDDTGVNNRWCLDNTRGNAYALGARYLGNDPKGGKCNAPPLFVEDLTDQVAIVNNVFSYQVNCFDIEDDPITYSINTTVPGIDSEMGLIDGWVPGDEDVGESTVKVTCADPFGSTSQSFKLTVMPRVDAGITSLDITFSDRNPEPDETIDVSAMVHNMGDRPLTNVKVRFFDGNAMIDEDQIISYLPQVGSQTVSVPYTASGEGFHLIKVIVDPDNEIANETNTDNNIATRSLLVGTLQDFGSIILRGQLTGLPVFPGHWFTVSGDAEYNTTFGAGEHVAGAGILMVIKETGQIVAQMHTRSDGTYRTEIIAPPVPGDYTLIITITDFTFTTKIELALEVISIPPKPDLVVYKKDISFNESRPVVDETLNITARIENLGNAAAGQFNVTFRDGSTVIDKILVPGLGVGSSTLLHVEWQATSKGWHTISVSADVDNDVSPEVSEGNNGASKSIYVYPHQPDLTPTKLAFSDNTPYAGLTITVTHEVMNIGGIKAEGSTTLVRDETFERTIDDPFEPSISAKGGSVSHQQTYTFAFSGLHEILLEADALDAVDEEDEFNNNMTVVIDIHDLGVDLTSTAVWFSNNNPLNGTTITIFADISNFGELDAFAVNVSFSDTGTLIGTTHIPFIPAGGSSETNISFLATPAGLHKIKVEIDPDNTISEVPLPRAELNNIAVRDLFVRSLTAPALQILSEDIVFSNTNPDENGNVTIIATVRNIDNQTAYDVSVQFEDVDFGIFDYKFIDEIPQGQERTVSTFWNAWPNGTHVISIEVDPFHVIPESGLGKMDNNATRGIIVGKFVDFEVSMDDITFNETPRAGKTVTMFVNISNLGLLPGNATVNISIDGVVVETVQVSQGVFQSTLLSTSFIGVNPQHTIVVEIFNVTPEDFSEGNNRAEKFVKINFPPRLNMSIPDVTFEEDGQNDSLNMKDYFIDANNDLLSYSFLTNDSSVSVAFIAGSIAKFTAAQDFNGVRNVTIFVTDGEFTVDDTVIVTVLPIPDAPRFDQPIGDQVARVGVPFTLDVDCTDPDGDTVTYLDDAAPFVIDSQTGLIQWAPEAQHIGILPVTVTCTDSVLSASASFDITIEENDPPSLNIPSPQITLEDTPKILGLGDFSSDPENDALAFAVVGETASKVDCIINGNVLTLSPALNFNGQSTCTISANDGFGGVDDTTFTIDVTPVNDAPVISPIPNKEAKQDVLFTYQVYATDVDGPSLSYSDNTGLFTINPSTGLISFTPDFYDGGVYAITITVSDGSLSSSWTFDLEVFTYDLDLKIDGQDYAAEHSGSAGDTVRYSMSLKNSGGNDDTALLTVLNSQGWNARFLDGNLNVIDEGTHPSGYIDIGEGQTTYPYFEVDIPTGPSGTGTGEILVTATSENGVESDSVYTWTEVLSNCYNDVKDGDEEGPDCGGSCPDRCGNLEIIEMIPIQVVKEAGWVKDKTSYIRARVLWTSDHVPSITPTVTAKFDGNVIGVESSISIDDGEIMNFDFPFTAFSEGFIRIDAKADQTFYEEEDRYDNNAVDFVDVKERTRPKLKYKPYVYDFADFDVFRYYEVMDKNTEFLAKTYPVPGADQTSSATISKMLKNKPASDDELRKILGNLELMCIFSEADFCLGVLPPEAGWISDATGESSGLFSSAVIIIDGDHVAKIGGHEVAHLFNLCDEYDLYEWKDQDTYLHRRGSECPNGDENDDDALDNGPPPLRDCYRQGCPTETIGAVPRFVWESELGPTYNYETKSWNNFMGDDETPLISEETYEWLYNLFTWGTPKRQHLLVMGAITKNGTLLADESWYIVNVTNATVFTGGNYSVNVFSTDGQLEFSGQFEPYFKSLAIGGEPTNLTVVGFSFLLPFSEDTEKITIENNGIVLHERFVSSNHPTTGFIFPKGGEVFGQTLRVSWNSSDEDGDNLTYILLTSSDGGETYDIIEHNLNEKSYILNMSHFISPPQSMLFKLVTSDGILTSEKALDLPVTINQSCQDNDTDGLCDVSDNCVNDPNPLQENFDHDGLGDICDPDDDNDGVLDAEDFCQFSVLPESVPTEKLLPNHYADIDGDGYFESVSPQTKLIIKNAVPFSQTFGCSCKEILATKPGEVLGEFKFGCTKGTLDVWSGQKGWAK